MYRIALCENNPDDSYRIELLLEKLFSNQKKLYSLSAYSSAEDFMHDFQPRMFDIILMDVEMGRLNGIEAAIQLRRADSSVVIIFTTAFAENVFSSFAAEPLNYLLKPVSSVEFRQTMETALQKVDALQKASFAFSFNSVSYRIPTKDIIYLESRQRLVYLHTTDQVYRFYGKLPEIRSNPIFQSFITCHHSFLVNPEYIQKISPGTVTMNNGERIPISKSHAKDVQNAYLDFISTLL